MSFFFEKITKKFKKTERIFTEIYQNDIWHGDESISGTGSSYEQTKIIIDEITKLFIQLRISEFMDIPCGDFHWMRCVDFGSIKYLGADIVRELIEKNISSYQKENIEFVKLNLLKDCLPAVDLIFCRDCLVHFSYKDIFAALNNFCRSNSGYLLTTTFVDREQNHDIKTGYWRVLNLQIEPFNFPEPLKIIFEGCTEGNNTYRDKALGLWNVKDIRDCL